MLSRFMVVFATSVSCAAPEAPTSVPSPTPVSVPVAAPVDAPAPPPAIDAPARPALAVDDCKALVAAPALAIATVVSSKTDCSGIGNKHIVFDVVRLVRGTAISRIVTSRPLYGSRRESFTVGDTFVVAIEPRSRPAQTAKCVTIPAHEGTVRHHVRAASAADAEHLVEAIAACP
jgi:hypothetical protein